MTYAELVAALRPHRWGTWEVEPFEAYRDRVHPLVPAWPDCPLRQWLWEHYQDAE